MSLVSFSIGSNIDREKNIGFAIKALKQKFNSIRFSPLYETETVGFKGDNFFNLVGQFETTLAVQDIKALFVQLEQYSGRPPLHQRFGDRTLDLDLLLYDDLVYKDDQIILPHPDVLAYDFVLMPLSQMMPDFILPGTDKTIATLWSQRKPVHKFRQSGQKLDDLLGPVFSPGASIQNF